jgi:phage-related protein
MIAAVEGRWKRGRLRWRFYETAGGQKPVATFIDHLSEADALAVHAQMARVRSEGTRAARHLVEDLWEVRAAGEHRDYRVLFSQEGSGGRVLLAVAAFVKTTQKTPDSIIRISKRRRDDWRTRGRS